MALPAFLKSPYVMGGAGVVGVAGISAASLSGGGSGEDYSQEIQQSSESRKNLIANLSSENKLETKCFEESFGSNKGIAFTNNDLNPDTSFQTPERPSNSSFSGVLEGCTNIQFSSKGNEAFVFQTETTVKNDKVGLALFSLGLNVSIGTDLNSRKIASKPNNILRYYLLFLEKGEGEDWSVKGGYSWMDLKFAYGFSGVKLHLKSPNGNINVDKGYSGFTGTSYDDKDWHHEMYSGSWKVGTGSSKEVFEDIEVWGGSKDHAEILGRDYTKTFEEVKDNRGYGGSMTSTLKYEYKDGRWHPRQTLKAETLDNWYTPFKGQKGTWVEKSQRAAK